MTYSLDYRKQVLKSSNDGMTFAEAVVFYDFSPTTIQKWKKRIGVSKKKTLEHPKACPVKTATYLTKLNDYITQGFTIVYIDESETMRPYGYAPIGSPCIDSYNWQAKDRTNVIGALFGKTLFTLDCLNTNVNRKVFYKCCKVTMIPKLKKKDIIVMDNASFHKCVQKLLNRHGHRLLFLPPYSPYLNPIKKRWAQVKFLRQCWMENDLSKYIQSITLL